MLGSLFPQAYTDSPQSSNLNDFLRLEIQSGRSKFGRGEIPIIEQRISQQIETGLPINLAVIAIAHKNPQSEISGNRKIPDLAEVAFLLHLRKILDGINLFYPPGAIFTILTEGGFYKIGDIFDVTEGEIKEYEERFKFLARIILGNRIRFESLGNIVNNPNFYGVYQENLSSISEDDFRHFIPVMERSITNKQRAMGITPYDMAKRYAALHVAKHHCLDDGGSAVYKFLDEALGENYIYCSITGNSRSEVLNIDTGIKGSPPPQHGEGVLMSGSAVVRVLNQEQMENAKLRPIYVTEYGNEPIGHEKLGERRK